MPQWMISGTPERKAFLLWCLSRPHTRDQEARYQAELDGDPKWWKAKPKVKTG